MDHILGEYWMREREAATAYGKMRKLGVAVEVIAKFDVPIVE